MPLVNGTRLSCFLWLFCRFFMRVIFIAHAIFLHARIASASSECSDLPAQKRSLSRAFSVRIHKIHKDEGVGKIHL